MRTRGGCIVMSEHAALTVNPFRRCPDDVQERDGVLA